MPIDETESQSLINLKHVLNYIKKQEKYSLKAKKIPALSGHFDDVNLVAIDVRIFYGGSRGGIGWIIFLCSGVSRSNNSSEGT